MEPRSTRANLIGAFTCAAIVLAFCLTLLWRDPLVFWNDDYQISILPVFDDIARSWKEGELPLLSPYSWVCGNLAGEFQYGTFSVFINAAVVVIWSIFHQFAQQAAALSIVHLMVLATGGFFLARQRRLSVPLAIMVSLIAALNGWIMCWGAPDWFGALGAFAWMPWAWWGLEKALGPDPDGTSKWWRFVWPAPFVYFVATGGFPYTIGMLGLLIAWLTVRSLATIPKGSQRRATLIALIGMLFGAALGFGLASPAIFALFSYVHGSARETQPATAHWQWIVPPSALPALIFPSWTVKWADFSSRYMPHAGTELAAGLAAPAAVICGLIANGRAIFRRLGWELGLLVVVLVIAMLPTAGVFRWSFRWLPFFHLVLALCAAESLRLLGKDKPRLLSPALIALLLAAAGGVAMWIFHTGGTYALPLTVILLGIAVVWWALERITSAVGTGIMPAIVTAVSLLATYLCIPPNCGVPRFNFTESLANPAPLDPNRLYFSIYPPPEYAYRTEAHPQPVGQIVRPGSTSMWAKLRFINGYSPIRPSGVAREFFFSIHGETDVGTATWLLYSESGEDGLLAELGVDGLTISADIDLYPEPRTGWDLVASGDEGRVFHRRSPPYATVRSLSSLRSRPGVDFASAQVSSIRESRNRVSAEVEVPAGNTPALIGFSRPYFDGYQGEFSGKQISVSSERHLFPIVELPAGSRGHLVLTYRPAWLVYGGGLAVGSALMWIGGVIGAAAGRDAFPKRPSN